MDRTYPPINNLLEQTACITRRSKEAAGETEPTEGYKRGQTEELIKFANDNSLWIDLSRLNITYMDRGGENEVFHDGNVSVVKLNNFEYAGDDLENFFIRITAHNKFFSNVPYQMIGFAYNNLQEFCAVLTQPYILAEREATEGEKFNLTWSATKTHITLVGGRDGNEPEPYTIKDGYLHLYDGVFKKQ